jgi:hypothetical protein
MSSPKINDAIHKSNKWRKDLKFNSGLKISFWEKFVVPRVMEIKGSSCETCGSVDNLDVHHTSYNIQTIHTLKVYCRKCHFDWHKTNGDSLTVKRSDFQPYTNNTQVK